MLLSMTSFGRATTALGDRHLVVEIKSLNSKFLDLRLKLPPTLSQLEMDIRKQIQSSLQRGKVELTITFENESGGEALQIHQERFKSYYKQLTDLCNELNIESPDLLGAIVRMPELVSANEIKLTEVEMQSVLKAVEEAISKLTEHRLAEGASIENVLRSYSQNIMTHLTGVDPFEKQRVQSIRSRMSNNLQEFMKKDNVDENRFEQEVMFYIEKIDITEEKVRLRQHCEYFLELLDDKSSKPKGRKLNFIGQEMGREINTLGAKAYSTDLQRLVVLMKDDLEKIKEQLANVL